VPKNWVPLIGSLYDEARSYNFRVLCGEGETLIFDVFCRYGQDETGFSAEVNNWIMIYCHPKFFPENA